MTVGTANGISSQTLNTATTLSSSSSTIPVTCRLLQMQLIVSNYTDGTYTPKIQYSLDSGSSWNDLIIGVSISANGTRYLNYDAASTIETLGVIRIQITSAIGIATGATIEGTLHCEHLT